MKGQKSHHKKKRQIGNYLIAAVLIMIYLVPLYILINLSLRTPTDFSSKLIFPKVLNLGNYISVLKSGELWNGFKNSIILVAETLSLIHI